MSLSFETFVKFRLVTKAQDLNWNKIQQDAVDISHFCYYLRSSSIGGHLQSLIWLHMLKF
jgi:hypothetical protein